MRNLVSDFASDALSGIALVYTRSHLRGCARCTSALAAVREVKERLHPLGVGAPPLEEARRAQVAADWERIDQAEEGVNRH